jgi:aspartate/methionine/tyrosine aminotransferase
MSHDLLMLRGDVAGGYNLAVGEPVFLQQAMGDLSKYHLTPPDMRYPPFAGTPSLLAVLHRFHDGRYTHFIVTVGAKQALVAAMYALSQEMQTNRVYTRAPYWPSYPTLVKSLGLEHRTTKSRPVAKDIVVNTAPNNPDGSCYTGSCDIWDAAYAHPVYGFMEEHEILLPTPRIAVYSAAKLLGLSGLRIGWLATNDANLARLAGEYVEKATSGVSTLDQYALEGILAAANTGALWPKYQKARATLIKNAGTYWEALGPHLASDRGAWSNTMGMFAWFTPKEPLLFGEALALSKVKLIPGPACGGLPDYYRMSLGHDPVHTQEALSALKYQLEENAR